MFWFIRQLKTTILFLVGFVVIGLFQNCGYTGTSAPELYMGSSSSFSTIPSYNELYENIFRDKCSTCHYHTSHFVSYTALMATGSVVPLNASASPMYQRVSANEMPQGGLPLSDIDKAAISNWINAGAREFSEFVELLPPTNVNVISVSDTSTMLSWTLPTQTVNVIKVERALSSSGPFSVIASLPATTVAYTDAGLVGATTYFYRLSAHNSVDNSPYTAVVSVITAVPPASAPAAPNTLVATVASSEKINLTWKDNSNNESGFRIERALFNTGPFTLITTTGVNVKAFSDSGLSASTLYYYRISSTNSVGSSAYTAVVSATTSSAPPPTAPNGLKATAISATQIDLTWVDRSNSETGFKIERAAATAGPFSLIYTTTENVTSYSVTGLTMATRYYFRVSARNGAGDSAFTSVVNAMTQAATTAPAAPTNLTATAASSAQINLSWVDNSTTETGFKVERATASGGPFTLIATTNANATIYSNTGLLPSTTYYFRVSSTNTVGSSATTTVISATTLATTSADAKFSWIKENVIKNSCLGCHNDSSRSGGLSFSSYSGVMASVTANNSAGSRFYKSIIEGKMPKKNSGFPVPTTSQRENIRLWIENGALNN